MPTHPTDPLDRIAELEQRLALAEAALRAQAPKDERTYWRQTWHARTCQREDGTYPAQNTARNTCRLPVVTREWQNPTGLYAWPTLVERKADAEDNPVPIIEAFCPLNWLPPLVDVEIARDRRGYRIVRWPTLLHGRCTTQFTGAGWYQYGEDPCHYYSLGSGGVHIYRQNYALDSLSVDTPQLYRDESPVLMTVWNTSNLFPALGKLLSFAADQAGRWVVTIEPCGGVCIPTTI